MVDLTKELAVLNGIPRWKWERLKAYVDAQFAEIEKQDVLALNKDALSGYLTAGGTGAGCAKWRRKCSRGAGTGCWCSRESRYGPYF